jgi:hypothetical protein
MKAFGMFALSVEKKGGDLKITYTAIKNPVKSTEILMLEAETIDDAASKASELLKSFGVKTHSLLGNPDTVMCDFPDYFVGEIHTLTADMYDTESLAFRISKFTPVKK